MQDEHDDIQPLSKSQRKRDATALQDLGSELVKLTPHELDKLPLDEELRAALLAAQKIKQHGAHKRQLQFIGKLMRNIDVEPIQQAYQQLTGQSREDVDRLHRLEDWRERLLRDGDEALHLLVEQYPDADRQQIRQWVRSAHKELLANKPPRAARELFQYLKSLLD